LREAFLDVIADGGVDPGVHGLQPAEVIRTARSKGSARPDSITAGSASNGMSTETRPARTFARRR
jgi:hypothetical protein